MLPFKKILGRLKESERIQGRANPVLQQYKLQVSNCDCEKGKNDYLVYHTFGHLATPRDSAKRVKGHFCKYFTDNYKELSQLASEYIKIKKQDLNEYVAYLVQRESRPDLFVIYTLSRYYCVHAAIITTDRVWYTFEGAGSLEDCKVVFAYRGGNVFINTGPFVAPPPPVKHRPKVITKPRRIEKTEDDNEEKDPTYVPHAQKKKSVKRQMNMSEALELAIGGTYSLPASPPSKKKSKKTELDTVEKVIGTIMFLSPSKGKEDIPKKSRTYEDDPDFVLSVDSSSLSSDVEEILPIRRSLRRVVSPAVDEAAAGPSEVVKVSEEGERGQSGLEELEEHDSEETVDYEVADVVGAKNVKKVKYPDTKKSKTVPEKLHVIRKKKKITNQKCTICYQYFANYSELHGHLRNVHGQSFYCDECKKFFSSKKSFNNHMKRHNPESLKHVCDVCQKRFLKPSDLRDHKISHSEERNFVCDYRNCNASFKFKGDLTEHVLLRHTKRPWMKCPECCQMFLGNKNLQQHFLTHGEPKKPCTWCGKMFRHTADLYKHRKYCDDKPEET